MARIIVEVRQRTWDGQDSRELGFFPDEMLAENTIQALYREAWSEVMKDDFLGSEWFPLESRDVIRNGLDYWMVDDLNSPTPVFYKVLHKMYQQVPSSVSNFTFSVDGADFF